MPAFLFRAGLLTPPPIGLGIHSIVALSGNLVARSPRGIVADGTVAKICFGLGLGMPVGIPTGLHSLTFLLGLFVEADVEE
eukprot:319682-Amorphochlora_amoeboformis.AAC.1